MSASTTDRSDHGARSAKPSLRWRIVRTDDLLNLNIECYNLALRNGALHRIDLDADALVIVDVGSQHVAEQVFAPQAPVAADDIPIAAVAAGASRLVFRLSPAINELPFTLPSLLDWGRALEPKLIGETRHLDDIAPPGRMDTAIELPTGLILAPFAPTSARWVHSLAAPDGADRAALWHTRLCASGASSSANLVAVWSADFPESDIDENPAVDPNPQPVIAKPFTTSLSPSDRRNLVLATHERQRAQAPLDADLIALSSMGGWLRLDGAWRPSRVDDPPLEKLHYRAAMGQDNNVVVVTRGFLYPTGHRAALVKITERTLDGISRENEMPGTGVARLVQHFHVGVNDPDRHYDADMIFKRLEALDVMTPALDETAVDIKAPFFWVVVAGRAFDFSYRATDWTGNESPMAGPALFMQPDAAIEEVRKAYADKAPDLPMGGRTVAVSDPFALVPHQADNANRYGDPLKVPRSIVDTALEVLSLQLDAEPITPPPAQAPFRTTARAFEARVPSLSRYLDPAANRDWFRLRDPIADGNLGEVFAERIDAMSDHPISVHFEQRSEQSAGIVAPSIEVAGLSRVFGPVADIAMLTGDPGEGFDLGRYFPDAARLLGTLPLNKVIARQRPTADGNDRSPAIPQFSFIVEDVKDEKKPKKEKYANAKDDDEDKEDPDTYHKEIEFKLAWHLPYLNDWPAPKKRDDQRFDYDNCLLLTGQGGSTLVADPDALSKIDIAVSYRRILGSPASTPDRQEDADDDGSDTPRNLFTLSGGFSNFSLQLLLDGNGVRARFKALTFSVDSQKTMKVVPHIETIELEGALLGFVRALQSVIGYVPGQGGGESPKPIKSPMLSTPGDGAVSVSLGPLMAPAVELGAFTLDKLSLRTTFDLYFSQKPMRMGLYLSSPQKPFELIAGSMGGGGFLSVRFDCNGITDFDISMEFGVIMKIDFKIAQGKAKLTGGIRFTMVNQDTGTFIELMAFVRLNGKVTILGFLEIALEVLVSLAAQVEGTRHLLYGTATVTASIRIAFFCLPISFQYQTVIGGSTAQQVSMAGTRGASRGVLATPSALLDESDWCAYWAAFADEN